jgi:hypothetical protein
VKNFTLERCYYARESGAATDTEKRGLQELAHELEEDVRWVARLIQSESRKETQGARARAMAEKNHALILSSRLVWAALKLKHFGFAEEKEWRLIDNRDLGSLIARGGDPLDGTKFRRGAYGVTPYLVVELPKRWRTAPLGIAEVIVGPSSNANATVASIQELLKSRICSTARVIPCDIPYRAW